MENVNNKVFVGMYHDQVLIPFKTLNKFDGINITIGKKILRLSPDHGTAKNLRGNKKNISNESFLRCIDFCSKKVKCLRKKYGQNFLVNENIVKKILSKENINNKNVLEIGTGNLALTKSIISYKPKNYIGVEVDKDLTNIYLKNNISDKIIFDDALKINEIKIFKSQSFSIISNLPFNISSELLIKWCKIQKFI